MGEIANGQDAAQTRGWAHVKLPREERPDGVEASPDGIEAGTVPD